MCQCHKRFCTCLYIINELRLPIKRRQLAKILNDHGFFWKRIPRTLRLTAPELAKTAPELVKTPPELAKTTQELAKKAPEPAQTAPELAEKAPVRCLFINWCLFTNRCFLTTRCC